MSAPVHPLARMAQSRARFRRLQWARPCRSQLLRRRQVRPGAAQLRILQVSIPLLQDPILTNNAANAVVQVMPSADLAITKTASPNPVNVNGSLTYTLQVTNNGPNTATAVVVTDALPGGVNFLSVSPANICSGPPVNTNGTVTCTISTLAMGASVPVTIVTTPDTVVQRNY